MNASGSTRPIWIVALIAWVLLLGPAPGRAQRTGAKTKNVKVLLWSVQRRGLDLDFAIAARKHVEDTLRSVGLFQVVDLAAGAATDEKDFGPACFENPECVQRLGRRTKTSIVFHLSVAESLGGVRYSLSSYSTRSGKRVRKQEDFSEMAADDVEQALRWMTLKASSPMITTLATGKGSLRIGFAEAGGELFINGKRFGDKRGKRFKVSAGVFDVVLNKEGFLPFQDVVMVKPGDDLLIQVVLKKIPEESKPDETGGGETVADQGANGTGPDGKPYLPANEKTRPAKPLEPDETAFYETWWFWTAIGAGLAGAAGTTAYFLLQDDGPSGVGGFEVTWP